MLNRDDDGVHAAGNARPVHERVFAGDLCVRELIVGRGNKRFICGDVLADALLLRFERRGQEPQAFTAGEEAGSGSGRSSHHQDRISHLLVNKKENRVKAAITRKNEFTCCER